MDRKLSPQQLDAEARAVIDRVLAGKLARRTGAEELLSLVKKSGIVEGVAGLEQSKYGGRSDSDRDDIAGHIYWVLTRNLLTPEDVRGSGYDFQTGSKSSFAGWVRMLSYRVAPDAQRSQAERLRRERPASHVLYEPVPDVIGGPGRGLQMVSITPGRSVATAHVVSDAQVSAEEEARMLGDTKAHLEVDTFVDGVDATARQTHIRPHLVASVALELAGVQPAKRPLWVSERIRMLKIANGSDGPAQVRVSLRAFLTGDSHALTRLWDDYTEEDAKVLLTHDDRVPQAIAVGALENYPLPKHRRRNALEKAVRARDGSAEFQRLVPDLVLSLLAVECHHAQPNAAQGGLELNKSHVQQWRSLLGAVASLPGSPLGSTVTAVALELRSLLMPHMPDWSFERLRTIAGVSLDSVKETMGESRW